jgi:hypothetical protein
MDYVSRYRELRDSGQGQDAAIGALRREGARFFWCLRAVCEVDDLSFCESRDAVHHSPAWSDGYAAREAIWIGVLGLVEEQR